MGTGLQDSSSFTRQTMRIFVFIDCKVKGIYFFTQSASWDCLARQIISIDVLYNREFKSDDEVNIYNEDKDVDVTIATHDHNKEFLSHPFLNGCDQCFESFHHHNHSSSFINIRQKKCYKANIHRISLKKSC